MTNIPNANHRSRLLIVTQSVDLDNPVLGFFHTWIKEFASKCESVSVICLQEGRHDLPANVQVYSLGKESGVSRIKYLLRFYKYIWSLRHDYDAVFVHMNQEYVLLGGPFWNIFGKKIVLWRNHKIGSIWTRVAVLLSQQICYTSPQAYVAGYRNAVKMPIGIDINTFVPPRQRSSPNTILFLGRIDAVKKPLEFVAALQQLVLRGMHFHADIYGEPTYPNDPFFAKFKKAVEPLVSSGYVTLFPAVVNEKTPEIYAAHAIYVNLTPSGSFDKTIGEAMSCGCVVIAANEVLRGVLPAEFLVNPDDIGSVTLSIEYALKMDPPTAKEVSIRMHTYVAHEHSLGLLVRDVLILFTKK